MTISLIVETIGEAIEIIQIKEKEVDMKAATEWIGTLEE